jgi:hypothetical protein
MKCLWFFQFSILLDYSPVKEQIKWLWLKLINTEYSNDKTIENDW